MFELYLRKKSTIDRNSIASKNNNLYHVIIIACLSSDNIFYPEISCDKVFHLEKKFHSKRENFQTSHISLFSV